MAPRIHVLEGALVDQIAAGEVVERPASVVKELVENALDAGATRVDVDIADGGRARIRVSDDGSGMDREDAARAVLRHATSKIREVDDLLALTTLGFRGEALPSIASVSRFSLKTRPEAEVAGTEVRIEGGAAPVVRDVGCAAGTSVTVEDLFFNVPARRKFLRAAQSESGRILGVCLAAALGAPALHLTVTSNGRKARAYLPARDWFERAETTFADEPLERIEATRDGVGVRAALGPPERARSGARYLHLFVNGRPVSDRALARAVAFAYGSVLPPGRYPAGVVHLDLEPQRVDVNAHPQKAEVRFAGGRIVHDALTRALASRLGTEAWSGAGRGPVARSPSYWDERLGGLAHAAPTAAERTATP
ncbi:MAG: DNA mismatch repair endonuclease MutL, partial [Myxococcales bacterium]|nr:DNA mismatch repair endonuclease MutL [Myxococcales bacterium]